MWEGAEGRQINKAPVSAKELGVSKEEQGSQSRGSGWVTGMH